MGTKHYVARLDTGGISYSGYEYLALGATPEEAKEAVARAYFRAARKRRGSSVVYTSTGMALRTAEDLDGWYGIRVVGPLGDGQATEVD